VQQMTLTSDRSQQ